MFELKGEFAPAWIPGTILFPDVDGNEAEEVAEHREWENLTGAAL